MKAATPQELESSFKQISSQYDVFAPIRMHDGSRSLGRLDEGPLALMGGRIFTKTTSVFFPQQECILTQEGSGVAMQQPVGKPLLVVGFTAEDADCLAFIDKFYSENFRDSIYFNKRDGSVVVVVSGRCGKDGAFQKIAGRNCDLELAYDGDRFLVIPYSAAGVAVGDAIKAKGSANTLAELKAQSESLDDQDQKIIEKASDLLVAEKVPEEFWRDISKRCIACTACNLSCPTCTCFDVFDWQSDNKVKRLRIWDSCQLDGFMREASGHNPMGTESLRTRRRIHHKLAADRTRWGHITCFLCGRCDDVCPTGIGIKSVAREMVKRYGQ
ncbi:MAG TPA: 4Fe-4S dicluster domain-containing protein [bacterium]|nr:4Fe-4S dicluster domain-containing protein [bacterium]